MEELQNLFFSLPLPYEYVIFPSSTERHAPKIKGLYYYVNRVITDLTRRTFQHGGFTQSPTFSKWNASWGRQYETPQYTKFQNWQKINHFAGAFLMGRKDDFHERMSELKERYPEIATFYPETYLLPKEAEAFHSAFPNRKVWIFKPAAAARGMGIQIFNSSETSEKDLPTRRGVFQVYIEKPLLITKRKFDLRFYALVTSVNPIRIYMHENGMARFATHEYDENLPLSNLRMHLTNFSLNKDDSSFILSDKEDVRNSKWSIQFFFDYIEKQGIDVKSLIKSIEKVSIAALISGLSVVREHHFQCIKHRHTSYELYGIDVILDEDLNPHIMEINISPSMEASAKLDKNIKYPLLIDTLNMARIIKCNSRSKNPCNSITDIDTFYNESMTPERINSVVNEGADPWESPVVADFVFIRDFLEENIYKTKFRRVFPKRETVDIFTKCFKQRLYSDIVFEKWIKMTDDQRFEVIQRSWNIYKEKMDIVIENHEKELLNEKLLKEQAQNSDDQETDNIEKMFIEAAMESPNINNTTDNQIDKKDIKQI
ncbi:hypothetical protein M9Y10_013289 [Tritrichomonas musculus]|uniref:Tubulin--tyrosine ligase-like protein 5 n=1 Tax=Tritrichomonas musculus TaxID=1915356 RepID=A0ABR2I6M8_9EUKA